MSRTVFSALLLLCLLFVIINPRWVNDVQKVSLIQSGPSVQMVLTSYTSHQLLRLNVATPVAIILNLTTMA